jgi:hypothetical protein
LLLKNLKDSFFIAYKYKKLLKNNNKLKNLNMERDSVSRKKALLALGMMAVGANSTKIANWQ